MVNHWISFDVIADKAGCDYLVVLNANALVDAGGKIGVAVSTESSPAGDGNAHPFPHGNPPCPLYADPALSGFGAVPFFCQGEKAFDPFLGDATALITFYGACQNFLPLLFYSLSERRFREGCNSTAGNLKAIHAEKPDCFREGMVFLNKNPLCQGLFGVIV